MFYLAGHYFNKFKLGAKVKTSSFYYVAHMIPNIIENFREIKIYVITIFCLDKFELGQLVPLLLKLLKFVRRLSKLPIQIF